MMRQDHIGARQQRAEFYKHDFSRFWTLITCRSRFGGRKNPITTKNGPLETHWAGRNKLPQLSGPSNPARVVDIAAESVPDREIDPRLTIESPVPKYAHSASNRSQDHRETGWAVTTRHVFWPNQRRKATLLLRNWQPNLDLAALQSQGWKPARGGRPEHNSPEGLNPKAATENFTARKRPLSHIA